MQLCAVGPPKCVVPPSDVEKMKTELEKIDKFMKEINAGNGRKLIKNLKQQL